ncbi:hypothetical protein C806_02741 [Lachnospiraceae bacterium 3-1]|nr:hypothetical protein C806_02741 [Lachnospiraceae bacterium 3-1]
MKIISNNFAAWKLQYIQGGKSYGNDRTTQSYSNEF